MIMMRMLKKIKAKEENQPDTTQLHIYIDTFSKLHNNLEECFFHSVNVTPDVLFSNSYYLMQLEHGTNEKMRFMKAFENRHFMFSKEAYQQDILILLQKDMHGLM